MDAGRADRLLTESKHRFGAERRRERRRRELAAGERSHQARSKASRRAEWTAAGRCADCGVECRGYRCGGCNAARTQSQRRRMAAKKGKAQ